MRDSVFTSLEAGDVRVFVNLCCCAQVCVRDRANARFCIVVWVCVVTCVRKRRCLC